jgi:hypothetical protein
MNRSAPFSSVSTDISHLHPFLGRRVPGIVKNKWPPGIPLRPPSFQTRTRSTGRYQQAHHQSIVFEIEFMIFP